MHDTNNHGETIMFGLATIRAMNEEAADKARRGGTEPSLIWHIRQIGRMPPFPFPFMGDACQDVDEEHQRIETLFCDSSGFGASNESALSIEQTRDRLIELVGEHGAILGAIEEAGQFQVHIAIWKA